MIKRLILVLGLMASLSFGQMQDIKWHSYDAMLQGILDNKIKQPIMLFVGQSTCQYCVQMLSNMHNSASFAKLINEKYFNVYVNQDEVEIRELYHASLTPTIFVINPENGYSLTPDPSIGLVGIDELEYFLERVSVGYDHYLESKK